MIAVASPSPMHRLATPRLRPLVLSALTKAKRMQVPLVLVRNRQALLVCRAGRPVGVEPVQNAQLTGLSRILDSQELFTHHGRMENRVKGCREAHGWSQGELARRLGVSRQTINAVETDKYDPSLPLALRMAKLFATPVDQLFIDHWEQPE